MIEYRLRRAAKRLILFVFYMADRQNWNKTGVKFVWYLSGISTREIL
jgi:hypothetical protein